MQFAKVADHSAQHCLAHCGLSNAEIDVPTSGQYPNMHVERHCPRVASAHRCTSHSRPPRSSTRRHASPTRDIMVHRVISYMAQPLLAALRVSTSARLSIVLFVLHRTQLCDTPPWPQHIRQAKSGHPGIISSCWWALTARHCNLLTRQRKLKTRALRG